jgi:hypothetical protein
MNMQATSLFPFLPAGKDFTRALAFMKELGFAEEWNNDGYAGLRNGGAYFILQDLDAPQWAEMQMITIEVPDLEQYWAALNAKNLTAAFPGTRINPPKDFPWGREIHLTDPAGVCWHVRQAAAKAAA